MDDRELIYKHFILDILQGIFQNPTKKIVKLAGKINIIKWSQSILCWAILLSGK